MAAGWFVSVDLVVVGALSVWLEYGVGECRLESGQIGGGGCCPPASTFCVTSVRVCVCPADGAAC